MAACQEVGRWITEEVLMPVEQFFERIGRTPTADDLCRPPAIAIFQYTTESFNGFISWWRPPAACRKAA